MATDRSPITYIWPTLKAFATGDVITRELLRDSINKAGDIGYGVLAALNERWQQLGSTNAGTSAVQRGSVVMGTLSFYDPVDVPVGSLDGKTLILETDLAGPVTITFAQPTSPVHVATQINTQGASLGLVASCDTGVDPNTGAISAANVGKLLLVRPSGGTASLTVKGAGTANALLGLPLVDTTTTGAGTVNDGASRIGVAAYGSFVGGTLRAALAAIDTASAAALALKASLTGATFTGPIVFNGTTARIRKRSVSILANTSSSFGPTADVFVVPVFSGASITYTVNTSSSPAIVDGDEIVIVNRGVNIGDTITIAQQGGGTLATFDGGDYGFLVIGCDGVNNGGSPTAYVKCFGSENGTIGLGVGSYPLP